jgi:hypothetical protein
MFPLDMSLSEFPLASDPVSYSGALTKVVEVRPGASGQMSNFSQVPKVYDRDNLALREPLASGLSEMLSSVIQPIIATIKVACAGFSVKNRSE